MFMDLSLANRLKAKIRDVKDFPKKGILFKDITPVLGDAELCGEIISTKIKLFGTLNPDVIVGIESRGFLLGMVLAHELKIPFVPVRKKGKLPYKTISEEYELEYGSAVLEMHEDALRPGDKVIIHDDLLATGGTAGAAARLVGKLGGKVLTFSFLIELTFLEGRAKLSSQGDVYSLVTY